MCFWCKKNSTNGNEREVVFGQNKGGKQMKIFNGFNNRVASIFIAICVLYLLCEFNPISFIVAVGLLYGIHLLVKDI